MSTLLYCFALLMTPHSMLQTFYWSDIS